MTRLFLSVIIASFAFACSPQEQKLTGELLNRYAGKATFMTNSTQQVLAGNLMMAIRENGTVGALEFCNAEAVALTDSMSTEMAAMLKRVTDKPRNPGNQANEREMEYITEMKTVISEGKKMYPSLYLKGSKVTGYYPIIANNLCMQCHGDTESEIASETLAMIKELYPEDQAVGYKVGDLRGIWVVEIDTMIHRKF